MLGISMHMEHILSIPGGNISCYVVFKCEAMRYIINSIMHMITIILNILINVKSCVKIFVKNPFANLYSKLLFYLTTPTNTFEKSHEEQ